MQSERIDGTGAVTFADAREQENATIPGEAVSKDRSMRSSREETVP